MPYQCMMSVVWWAPPSLAKSCILGCQAHWSTKKVDVKKAVLGSFGVYCETQALCEVSKYKFNQKKNHLQLSNLKRYHQFVSTYFDGLSTTALDAC